MATEVSELRLWPSTSTCIPDGILQYTYPTVSFNLRTSIDLNQHAYLVSSVRAKHARARTRWIVRSSFASRQSNRRHVIATGAQHQDLLTLKTWLFPVKWSGYANAVRAHQVTLHHVHLWRFPFAFLVQKTLDTATAIIAAAAPCPCLAISTEHGAVNVRGHGLDGGADGIVGRWQPQWRHGRFQGIPQGTTQAVGLKLVPRPSKGTIFGSQIAKQPLVTRAHGIYCTG